MKGQAFVGLPSEFAAEKALKDTNGYILQGKPIVVVSFSTACIESNTIQYNNLGRHSVTNCDKYPFMLRT